MAALNSVRCCSVHQLGNGDLCPRRKGVSLNWKKQSAKALSMSKTAVENENPAPTVTSVDLGEKESHQLVNLHTNFDNFPSECFFLY